MYYTLKKGLILTKCKVLQKTRLIALKWMGNLYNLPTYVLPMDRLCISVINYLLFNSQYQKQARHLFTVSADQFSRMQCRGVILSPNPTGPLKVWMRFTSHV